MPVLKYWDVASQSYIELTGPGKGIPPGGATDDVLVKASATDYDCTWGLPALVGYADVSATPPDATAPVISPPDGFLWVDTSIPDLIHPSLPRGYVSYVESVAQVDCGAAQTVIVALPTLTVPAGRRYKVSAYAEGFASGFQLANATLSLNSDLGIASTVLDQRGAPAGVVALQGNTWMAGQSFRLFVGGEVANLSVQGISATFTGGTGVLRVPAGKARILVEDVGQV
jgi:hypothetical protein